VEDFVGMMFSIADVASLFGISKTTVRRKIKAGEIKAIKVGRQYRVPLEEVLRIKSKGLVSEGK